MSIETISTSQRKQNGVESRLTLFTCVEGALPLLLLQFLKEKVKPLKDARMWVRGRNT